MFRLTWFYFTDISQKYIVGSNNLLGAAISQWSDVYIFRPFCRHETT